MRRQPKATFPVPENTFQISLFSFKSSSNSFCVFLLQLHLGLYSGVDSAAMTSVAVAVNGGGGGKGSRRAVLWAVENLMPEADRFILVHVMPKITSIPTPSTFSFFLYFSLWLCLVAEKVLWKMKTWEFFTSTAMCWKILMFSYRLVLSAWLISILSWFSWINC